MRSWIENEDILQQFRDWLVQTDEQIAALPDEGAASGEGDSEPLPEIGLLQLVEAFTSLRHELKLETKSARRLEETVQTALQGLQSATAQMQNVQAREAEAAEREARPLVEALINLDEGLERAAGAIEQTRQQLVEEAPRRLVHYWDEQLAQQPFWRRWLLRRWHRSVCDWCRQQVQQTNGQLLQTLLAGFRLIQQRLHHALREGDIRRIECLGEPVDPARMKVVDLVDQPDMPPETVVQVLRPGYAWRGKVVRFAEVRATPACGASPEAAEL